MSSISYYTSLVSSYSAVLSSNINNCFTNDYATHTQSIPIATTENSCPRHAHHRCTHYLVIQTTFPRHRYEISRTQILIKILRSLVSKIYTPQKCSNKRKIMHFTINILTWCMYTPYICTQIATYSHDACIHTTYAHRFQHTYMIHVHTLHRHTDINETSPNRNTQTPTRHTRMPTRNAHHTYTIYTYLTHKYIHTTLTMHIHTYIQKDPYTICTHL